MGEITAEQHSLQAVDQEAIFPDTPAFRSMATNVSTQNHFDNTAENSKVAEPIQRRKDTFGYRGSGELDLDKVVKKLETEKIKQEKIEKETREQQPESVVLRGRLPNQQIVITEKDETISRYSKSSERNSTKTNRTTHTIILHSPDQEQQEDDENGSQNSQRPGGSVYSLISSQITGKNKYKLFLEEKMKKMQTPQPEEGQNGMKKVFTTNLLDLLSHRKDTPSPQQVLPEQTRSPMVARRQIKIATKGSHDFSEESNFLTLSLVSPSKQHVEELKKRGIERPNIPVPLRFGTLENIRGGGGEMISPIGYVKSGSMTPYSNGTAKQGNVSEIHDERTITNMDNLSRFDFDKYSFVAEVREVEVNQHTSYDESVGAFRPNSRKFAANMQHMKSLESEETYRKITACLDGKGVVRFDTEDLTQSNLVESKF